MSGIRLGIVGLDDIVGYLDPGMFIAVTGPSGSGKTVFSLQFIHSGAKAGEPGLYVALWERKERLLEYSRRLGIDLEPYIKEGLVDIVGVPAAVSDTLVDSLVAMIERLLREKRVKRLVIDGISPLLKILPEPKRVTLLRNIVYEMVHAFQVLGLVTLNPEATDPGTLRIASDMIIELDYELGTTATYPRRIMRIPKSRGMIPESLILEFKIERGGIIAYPLRFMKPGPVERQRRIRASVEAIDSQLGGFIEKSIVLLTGGSGTGKSFLLRKIGENLEEACYISLKSTTDLPSMRCALGLPTWATTPMELAYQLLDIGSRYPVLLIDNLELVRSDYGVEAFHTLLKALYGLRGKATVILAVNDEILATSEAALISIYADYVARLETTSTGSRTLMLVKAPEPLPPSLKGPVEVGV